MCFYSSSDTLSVKQFFCLNAKMFSDKGCSQFVWLLCSSKPTPYSSRVYLNECRNIIHPRCFWGLWAFCWQRIVKLTKLCFLLILHFLADLMCFADIFLYLCNTIIVIVLQR